MPNATADDRIAMRRALIVLVCACLVLVLANGVRTSLGLYLVPMTTDLGWSRESFAFALALQNLVWGASQPLAGAYADRFGYGRVIAVSAGLYAAGLALMAFASTPLDFSVNAGVLIGIALSGTGFPIMLAVVGVCTPESKRSLFIGIAGAGGASGQLLVVPGTHLLIGEGGWSYSLLMLAGMAAVLVPLAAAFSGKVHRMLGLVGDGGAGDAGARAGAPAPGTAEAEAAPPPPPPEPEQTMTEAIRRAGGDRGYWYLTCGFFVCGFHVVFIATHFPAYIADQGLPASLGATSLVVIGLANIVGSATSGVLGGRFRKKNVLSGLYLGRAVVIAAFVLSPVSEVSVLVFSFAIGLLWLATVPLTSALVAQKYGTRYMATLFGFVFLGHQLGSFLGAWLGGYLYDALGSYDAVWWMSVALGVAAALLHWPIREPLPRFRLAARTT